MSAATATGAAAGCPFCEMVMEYITSGVGIEQIGVSGVYHFEPLNPVTPGHRLFVPAFHYEDAAEAPSATGAVFEWAAYWAAEQGEDFNLIVNCGPAATQTVRHLHVHYVPRRPGDGLILPWSHQHAGEAHTPTDAEPEQTEFYEVMGGQGLRRIAKNLTREEAEAVRYKFDHDCAAYGLFNPPTRINKQPGRY